VSHAFSFLCFANHQEYFTIDWGVAFRSAFTKILYHRCMYQCTRYFGRVAFFLSSLSFPPTINVSMLRRSLIFNHQSSMTRWFALPAYKPYCSLRVACADFIWWQLQSLTGHRPPQPSALHRSCPMGNSSLLETPRQEALGLRWTLVLTSFQVVVLTSNVRQNSFSFSKTDWWV